jgi:hypothetical protein
VTVHDAAGAPITDATVTVKQGSRTFSPDSPGSYSFSNLPPDVATSIRAFRHHNAIFSTTTTSPAVTVVITAAFDEQGDAPITLDPAEHGTPTVALVRCPSVGGCPA